MKISEIGIPKGANKRKKRRGRGAGSGHGKTSGKGHKGSKSRTGHHGGPRIGFEGGQMPLIRRIPKRGFINEFKKEFTIVNLGCLNKFSKDAVISPQELFDANLIKDKSAVVKVLGDGEMTKSLTVKAHRFSKSAVRKIEKAGGSIVILSG
ncbi:MAG: 50S ribosomal protein L15, partial [Candidatus Omnitrophica bacterium]|nr:50S ribosomal protein L15 [Candidatus Omnitrophota bacterium]